MNTRASFGQKITEARTQKKISIETLANMLAIEPNNLSRIENGKYNVGLDLVLKIANALELDLLK